MNAFAGLEPLALSLDQTEFRTVESLLQRPEYRERIDSMRNNLGLPHIMGWPETARPAGLAKSA
jgi:hypothetical protein